MAAVALGLRAAAGCRAKAACQQKAGAAAVQPTPPARCHILSRRALGLALGSGGVLALGLAPAARALKDPVAELVRLAAYENDPEVALEVWDSALELDSTNPAALLGRANALLLLGRWADAAAGFKAAAPLLKSRGGSWVGGGEKDVVALPPSQGGRTVPTRQILEVLAYDGLGLAEGQLGNWPAAREAFDKALATLAAGGSSLATVPESAPFSGLRGGAATIGQRVELHAAMAAFAGGDKRAAVAALEGVDKGPNPDGYPQFWDARAALAAALAGAGRLQDAEAEWASLCRPTPVPPPAVPTNPLFAGVNSLASALGETTGLLIDGNCEDYETGVYVPCDDAGIPGLGGSSSPCTLYSAEEARARLWPAPVAEALGVFIKGE